MNSTDLMQLTVVNLRKMAKELGLRGYSKLRKQELVDMLRSRIPIPTYVIDYVAQRIFLQQNDITYLNNNNVKPDWFLYYMRILYPYPEDMPKNLWYDLLMRALHFNNTFLAKKILLKERLHIGEDMKQEILGIAPSDVIDVMNGTYDKCLLQISNIDECLSSLPEFVGEEPWFNDKIKSVTKQSTMIAILAYLQPLENICLPQTKNIYSSLYEIQFLLIKRKIKQKTGEQSIDPILDNKQNLDLIQKCKGDIFIIPTLIENIGDDGFSSLHSIMIIIDNIKKTVERFEPHGQYSIMVRDKRLVDTGVIDEAIKDATSKIFPGYKFISTLDFCPRIGPQASENYAKSEGFTQDGFCAAFSMLYLHLRLTNPDMSQKEVVELMMKGGMLATYKRISKYANLMNLYII